MFQREKPRSKPLTSIQNEDIDTFPVRTSSKIDLLGDSFSNDIRPFIDAIDSLRRFGVDQDVDLPRVVVVGDQSSGKSSIIEAISGVELPRGSGIVTRCPLELQLMRVPSGQAWSATVSYGLGYKVNLDSPTLVDASIREAQNQICGNGTEISDNLITLSIKSPAKNAPDLTLIDLPGIARTAVSDQSEDICEKIRRIIENYIKAEKTIILCVVSANLDAAVNESISLALKHDRTGSRTLGVITKPDLAEEHLKDGVLCLLNNEKIPLSKGYLMVKCRSHKDLDNKVSLEKSLEKEDDFFQTDEVYKEADCTKLGTKNLARKITEELITIIQSSLGSIVTDIDNKLKRARDKLDSLPKEIPTMTKDKFIYLNLMVAEFNEKMKKALTKDQMNLNKEINLFNDWRPVFEKFKNDIRRTTEMQLRQKYSVSEILKELDNRRGEEISGFLNYEMFKNIVGKEIKTYEAPALEVATKIALITENRLKELMKEHFGILEQIQRDFSNFICEIMKKQLNSASKRIKKIFQGENLIFTMDDTFDERLELMVNEMPIPIQLYETVDDSELTHEQYVLKVKEDRITQLKMRKSRNAEELQELIKCYLNIVISQLADQIPIVTRTYLHVDLCKILYQQLISYTVDIKENITDVVQENSAITGQRKTLTDQVIRLENAQHKLNLLESPYMPN